MYNVTLGLKSAVYHNDWGDFLTVKLQVAMVYGVATYL